MIRKIDVIPISRLQNIRGSDLARSTEATRLIGPCGGFSTQYACMCDLYNVLCKEEVVWVNQLLNNCIFVLQDLFFLLHYYVYY